MAVLEIYNKTTEFFIIKDSEWTAIQSVITANKKAVAGAVVSFAITNGKIGQFENASVTTDAYGICTNRFKAKETGRFIIRLTATKAGYTAGTFDVSLLGLAGPVDYTDDGSLYLNILEKRKMNICKVLQEYLDNDPEFYGSTGASGQISYMTEWNFQWKDFPLIVVSSSSPSFNNIGLNNFIDEATYGGIVDVDFLVNIVAENKNILDRLAQKCLIVLSNISYFKLYGQYGIHVELPINSGSVETEPYGAKLLYGMSLTMKSRVEFAYNVSAKDSIEEMTVTHDVI